MIEDHLPIPNNYREPVYRIAKKAQKFLARYWIPYIHPVIVV
jgi:hypothetical protein